MTRTSPENPSTIDAFCSRTPEFVAPQQLRILAAARSISTLPLCLPPSPAVYIQNAGFPLRRPKNNQTTVHRQVSPSSRLDSTRSMHAPDPDSDACSCRPGPEERSDLGAPMPPAAAEDQSLRLFVATWNVGGKAPHGGMSLDGLLPSDDRSDVYVLGFQEIVPLNAGNVLGAEDNEPALRWLALINQVLNKPASTGPDSCADVLTYHENSYALPLSTKYMIPQEFRCQNGLFFQKQSLKSASKNFRTETKRKLKSCNCPNEAPKKYFRESCFSWPKSYLDEGYYSSEDEELVECTIEDAVLTSPAAARQRYSLVACKQMVGIFITVWARRELVQHVGHLRLSTIGRGVMGYLGNKGCISVSLSLYQTSFCFICSHLASGEKEGDELRRNSDVIEILKNTQFPNICKTPFRRMPGRILDHDRVIWLGDLNYRISLSYSESRKLVQHHNWEKLLEKDQLKIERESGRVFSGWNEGKIYFAPTYKYSRNSDVFAGEAKESKKKKRTPA